MILRDYQERAIASVREHYRAGKKRVLLVGATGFGKTATASALMAASVQRGKRALFLVHRREIVLDTARRLRELGLRVGVIMADVEHDAEAPVQVASVQTITARGVYVAADLVVWDEAHHVAAVTYREIREQYPNAWHLGLTATPMRADGAGLVDAFDEIVVAATTAELQERGFLVGCDALVLEQESGIFPAELAFNEHAPRRSSVIFASSVERGKEIARSLAVPFICGETPNDDRALALDAFAAGDWPAIVNVNVLTEGWDCLDESTEILTPNGWCGIGQVREGDLVESLNTESGRMESVPVLDYGERDVRAGERMARIESQHADIRTTEGHRFYIKYRDPGRAGALSKGFLVKTGTELAERSSTYALPISAEHSDAFPGVSLTDDEIRFVAWFMTDGGFHDRAVCISQSKAYVDEIRALLCRINLDFRERVRAADRAGSFPNGMPLHEFIVPKGTGTQRRRGWFKRFESYLDKNVSAALHAMTREQFQVFWAELLKGDGEQLANKSGWLWCDRREQADAYTAMAVRRGLAASYSTRVTKSGHTMYRVSVRDKQWIASSPSDARSARITLEPSRPNERVWCVTNRNGTLVTRRGGKIAILGNCPRADCVILERNCSSVAMYLQIVGRVLRADPGNAAKRALLIDLSRNVRTHGMPDEPREFALDGKPIKRKSKLGPSLCAMCGASKRPGAESCWKCGVAFKKNEPEAQLKIATANTRLIPYAAGARISPQEWTEMKEAHLRDLERQCAQRGYKRGWTAHRFRNRWGHWPWEMEKAS